MPSIPLNPRKTDYKRMRGAYYKDSCRFYGTAAWKRMRITQFSKDPLCARCMCYGKIVVAEHVDHVFPHKGISSLFFGGELCSLCHSCHSWKTTQESLGKIYTWREKKELLLQGANKKPTK